MAAAYLDPHCISISTDNASVNDVIISTVACILLAKYGIPQSPNLHIHCICHIVNLVVQAILAALREADNPGEVDHYTLNKEQPLHLDINTDPDQIELDSEEFQDEVEDDEDNITLEEEEKVKATKNPLSKKMEKHLEAISISWKHSFKIQQAAEQGLAKLRKYPIPTKLHHSYILGTVLHPCLQSQWFAAPTDPDDVAAQEVSRLTVEQSCSRARGKLEDESVDV
ncbi:hypothetical protein F5148DRAFT_1287610 [Russula earlei]|uniref:Uncharacterized protein n=1 Tax=Russula earlei TaxID=71964 RepID=A0ACC0U2H1_9AGAM|nr:hypothetical protein F5148DRAFT_1287610 [Russula earlei]